MFSHLTKVYKVFLALLIINDRVLILDTSSDISTTFTQFLHFKDYNTQDLTVHFKGGYANAETL